jgi:hypothetical protein
VNDWISTQLSGAHGPVHTGSGNQYVGMLFGPKGKSPRGQAADDMRWLAQRFVPPNGFSKAHDILQSHRTVFLDGPAGSGRIAAAKMLLWEFRSDTENFQELLPQEDGDGTRLDLSHIGDGDRAWLDLTSVGELWGEIRSELSGLRAVVQARQAHLVIVLPQNTDDLPPGSEVYLAKIKQPPIREVLFRYLKTEDIALPESMPSLPFLDGNPPLERVYKYVRLIEEARETAPVGSTFGYWCEAAYRALSGRVTEVDGLVAKLDQGAQRALLLTTAMLHGAHADSIYEACSLFLRIVEHPADERPMLEHATLYRRLREIRAEVDRSGHVHFEEPGYDSAVRDYIWTHMPELHDRIQAWVRRAVDSGSFVLAEQHGLVRRFVEQCLSDKYVPLVISLVEQWTGGTMASHRMAAAALALQCGLRDEKCGRTFRRQIYDWSRMDNLPDSRSEVIIATCRDEMAVTHPDEALVRLHHVARRERRTRTRARDTLIELAQGDRRFLHQLLSRLIDPSQEGRARVADVDIFLALVDPSAFTDSGAWDRALIADRVTRQQVIDGWKLVFAVSREGWIPRAQQWLRRASEGGRHADMLLDVLVAGAQQSADVLASLYAMTRTRELRGGISGRVLQKIDDSLGVQFT